MAQLAGKVMRTDAEVILIFKVNDKYYPATESNAEAFETYLHTGDPKWLDQLDNELEV